MPARLTAKGQVTIPKEIRDQLGLKPGDRVKFFMDAYGTAVMLPMRPASALRGIVKHRGKPVTIDEMNEAVLAGAAEEFASEEPR